jgi:hypothetical protein
MPHEDEDERTEDTPLTFGLFPFDRPIQTRLLDACRTLLQRATPDQIRDLAYLIYALQRLPLVTPKITGGVTLTTRYHKSAAHRGFELDADDFRLITGESMESACGPDHGFHNVLEVGTSAMRDIYEWGDVFTEWLDMFCEQAGSEATEIEIHCDSGDSIDLYSSESILWEENPLLDDI